MFTAEKNNCERCDGTGWDFKNNPIPPFPKCPCDTRAAIWHICEGLAKAGAAND